MQTVRQLRCLSALLLLTHCMLSAAPYLPSEGSTTWNHGIPGDLPFDTMAIIDAVEVNAIPNDSSADATPSLQTALDGAAATGGGVVYLREGTYRVDGELSFNGDSIILRGAGPDKTKLYLGFAGNAIFVGMYGRGEWQPVVDARKGSTTMTVSDGSLFTPGEFAELQQLNDTALMITDPEWDVDWAQNMVGQMFEVVAVEGNTVSFRSPLHYDIRMDRSPQIRPQRLRNHCGIEQLYLEKTIDNGHTIIVKNAAYCRIREIESCNTRKAHIETASALGCQFSENYLHHSFSYGGGGSGYGISLHTHTSDCLVENNIFNHLRHAMIIQNGATGNVFAYNFSTDPVQGESDSLPLNETWDPPDISFHGHYAQYNLCEGNIVTEVGISDYWGPMGPGNTFFRNSVSGGNGMHLHDHSHQQNIIGNTLVEWSDDSTSEETIFHGNSIANAPVVWNEVSGLAQTLPASLFLTERPGWWSETIPWPGTGSDLTGSPVNPAYLRFESGRYFGTATRKHRAPQANNTSRQPVSFFCTASGGNFRLKSSRDGQVQIYNLRGTCCYRSLVLPAGTHAITLQEAPGMYLVFWRALGLGEAQVVRKVLVP